MSSRFVISGDNPPCTHRNCWFMRAARGRQSKASIHASYTRSEYLILPVEYERGKPIEREGKIKWQTSTNTHSNTALCTGQRRQVFKRPSKHFQHRLEMGWRLFLPQSKSNSSDMCKHYSKPIKFGTSNTESGSGFASNWRCQKKES